VFFSLIEGLIRNISGSIGVIIRRIYYKFRLGKCGSNVVISENVYFDNPRDIQIGNGVWIDRNAILIAGKISNRTKVTIYGEFDQHLEGKIIIGSRVHIGINTVIQGHGGVQIGDYFTSSPFSKIYSLSNDVIKCHSGTVDAKDYIAACILSQVVIGSNVWLGLNASVLGASIGSNSFVKPNSVVTEGIEENCVAEGSPAIRIKSRFGDSIK
jgi:acetyltransferase-like isoleucine patch superfamily enzyme